MVINGKEYGFKLTVGASIQIAKLCPNGDLSRIAEAVGGEYGQQAEAMAKFVEALSNGYAAAEEFEGRKANRLTYGAVGRRRNRLLKGSVRTGRRGFRRNPRNAARVDGGSGAGGREGDARHAAE